MYVSQNFLIEFANSLFHLFLLQAKKAIDGVYDYGPVNAVSSNWHRSNVVTSRIMWAALLLDGWTRDSQHTRGS